ncbi:hypothetical protein ACHAWF_007500 [Thalassiosira exigua]
MASLPPRDAAFPASAKAAPSASGDGPGEEKKAEDDCAPPAPTTPSPAFRERGSSVRFFSRENARGRGGRAASSASAAPSSPRPSPSRPAPAPTPAPVLLLRRASSSTTKSWTDQRAPEPFSSPASKPRPVVGPRAAEGEGGASRKYGYGYFLRSGSAGSGTAGRGGSAAGRERGRGDFPRSASSGPRGLEAGTADGGAGSEASASRSFCVRRCGGAAPPPPSTDWRKRPSFASSDFPPLSPATPGLQQGQQRRQPPLQRQHLQQPQQPVANYPPQSHQQPQQPQQPLQPQRSPQRRDSGLQRRNSSWSAVVCGGDGNDATKYEVDDVPAIPPLPLFDAGEPRSEEADAYVAEVDREVSSEEEGGDAVPPEPRPPSPTRDVPRTRARSFHHFSDDDDRTIIRASKSFSPLSPDRLFRPCSTFAATSIAALQNDIGTLLARSHRVDEALERYRLGIDAAKAALERLEGEARGVRAGEGGDDDGGGDGEATRPAQCPRVTEAEGLAWYRQKLLRGDIAAVPPPPPRPAESDPGGGAGGTGAGDDDEGLRLPEEGGSPSSSSPTLSPPRPFQPAGFGGLSRSPRGRLRSASFSVVDLHPRKQPPPPLTSGWKPADENARPGSPPGRRPQLAARTSPCPLTAPVPAKPTLPSSPALRRSESHGARGLRVQLGSQPSWSQRMPRHNAAVDDIVHEIHQHQKLDRPDEVYSCNGRTPLGMEYVCDPFPVLGSALRRFAQSEGGDDDDAAAAASRDAAERSLARASLVAARLNAASLEYRRAGGGASKKLREVLPALEAALGDCAAAEEAWERRTSGEGPSRGGRRREVPELLRSLRAVAHSNLGTVRYRLKMVRDAAASFAAARAALEDEGPRSGRGRLADLDDDRDDDGERRPSSDHHDDDRFPPREYLLLVVRLNSSRAALRMRKMDDAEAMRKLIVEDDKPHRRSSSRRTLLTGPYHHRGFRRSSSFSATSSALDAAAAAYEHDVDRRSKWLRSVAEHYVAGLVREARGEPRDHREAWHHYNRLLSLARVKLDHRHPHVCSLLERRGAVLFEQRKLQCSLLSYLACLKILEHRQSSGSDALDGADLSRVLYAVARVLHDKEEYRDALHLYHRALACQRALAAEEGGGASGGGGRPSLEVITTLCNVSRVHHLSGEIDEALAANAEVLELATVLAGGRRDHPFLIHRLRVGGNILVEAGRVEEAMDAFAEAARLGGEGGCERMIMGGGGGGSGGSQEDADAGDASVLSVRSRAALVQANVFNPSAAAA